MFFFYRDEDIVSNLKKKAQKSTNNIYHPRNFQQNVSLALDIIADATVAATNIFNQITF